MWINAELLKWIHLCQPICSNVIVSLNCILYSGYFTLRLILSKVEMSDMYWANWCEKKAELTIQILSESKNMHIKVV